MSTAISEEERAALQVLRATNVGVLEAALVAKEALGASRGRVSRAKKCIRLGTDALRQREKTVSFETAVAEALEARKDRRARTLSDFRYICRRLMKRCPGLTQRRIRSITPQECDEYLHAAFDTPRQFVKAKAILSAVFSTARRRGWCGRNPVQLVESPRVVEQPITVLTPTEIEQLLKTAEEYDNGSCLPAVGLMLYAGIRPHEVERLTWAQIDLENETIAIEARHSKTGGSRRVTIHPPLRRLLKRHQRAAARRICPRGWTKRWRGLHHHLPFRWVPDILRTPLPPTICINSATTPRCNTKSGTAAPTSSAHATSTSPASKHPSRSSNIFCATPRPEHATP